METRTTRTVLAGVGALAVLAMVSAGAVVAQGGGRLGAAPDQGQATGMGRGMGPGMGRGMMGPGGPGFGRGRGGPGGPAGIGAFLGGPLAGQLGITDDQKAQIQAVLEKHREAGQALMGNGRTLREKLHQAIVANDQGTIVALGPDLGTHEAALASHHATVRAEVFALLTAEQQAKAKEWQDQRGQRRGDFRGRGFRGGAPAGR